MKAAQTKQDKPQKKASKVNMWLIGHKPFVFMMVYVFLMLTINNGIPTPFNVFLVAPVIALILFTLPYRAGSIVFAAFLFIIFYLNEFICISRGRPISFMDIYSIHDALNVAPNYTQFINITIVLTLILDIVLTIIFFKFLKDTGYEPKKEKKTRQKAAVVFALISIPAYLLLFLTEIVPVHDMVYDEKEYLFLNGYFFGWYSEYRQSKIALPKDYSDKLAHGYLDSYDILAPDISSQPDKIIVIMNEALCDYSLSYKVSYNEDPMPFIHSLDKNCAKGRLHVNIFGGNTCNTEYEFLTGNSLAFLPINTMPYLQYDLKDSPSMVKDMPGWETLAFHPYYRSGYKRDIAYEGLGFNRFISGENLAGQSDNKKKTNNTVKNPFWGVVERFGDDYRYIRNFISDESCYDIIGDELDRTKNKEFIFLVTIQNHAGYMNEYDTKIDFLKDDNGPEEQYLNLVRESDDAYKKLISALQSREEKTVVVMFGDHQPPIFSDKFTSLDTDNDYERLAAQYSVPYVIWSNYDAKWDIPYDLSVNYLSAYLRLQCSLGLSSYDMIRLDTAQKYPVLTYNYSMDTDGNYVSTKTILNDEAVKRYQYAQYYLNQ